MYTISPVFIIITGFLAWILVLIGLIWALQKETKDLKILNQTSLMFRGIGFLILTFWALILFDSFIKFVFLNQMSINATLFYIFPIVIGFISAVIFLMGAVFIAPTKKTITTFFAVLGVYIHYYWGNGNLNLAEKEGIYIPLIYALALQMIIFILFSLIRVIRKQNIKEEPIWDKKEKYAHIFQPKVCFGFFVLYSILLCELFAGYSPFAYGPGGDNITQFLLDSLMLTGFGIWIFIEIKRKRNLKDK